MEAIEKTTNSRGRGHKHIKPDLNNIHKPYVITEEDKGRRKR